MAPRHVQIAVIAACAGIGTTAAFAPWPGGIVYRVHVDSAAATMDVAMNIPAAPHVLRLAFARHPEYDDQVWRDVRDLVVESGGRPVPLAREGAALWRATLPGASAVVTYRLALPRGRANRRAWRPVITGDGALVGGDTFLYVVGEEETPVRVALEGVPPDWQIATGLESGAAPNAFRAPSAVALVDSPILMGRLRRWDFAVDGVPHHVVYWPLPDAAPFDTVRFVSDVSRIARAAAGIFGRPVYRDYWFLFQDGAGDALEHGNSLVLGARSSQLADNPDAFSPEIAHEYFHTWNLVRIRPAEWEEITPAPPRRTTGLWWGEGVTMYYADALLRRAGLRDSPAAQRALADWIANYFRNPGNTRISPERASWTANDPPSVNGGFTASYYTTGSLLAQVLDIVIRDSTGMRRGLDDVMRAALAQYGGPPGFRSGDLEHVADSVCGCDLGPFFTAHVRGAEPLDVNRYLASLGWRAAVSWSPAADSSGRSLPDRRVFAYLPTDSTRVQLVVWNPLSAWGRAGLRTNDQLVAVDGVAMPTAEAFRTLLARTRIGDRLRVRVLRAGRARDRVVKLTGYADVHVRLQDTSPLTAGQRRMRALWMTGDQP